MIFAHFDLKLNLIVRSEVKDSRGAQQSSHSERQILPKVHHKDLTATFTFTRSVRTVDTGKVRLGSPVGVVIEASFQSMSGANPICREWSGLSTAPPILLHALHHSKSELKYLDREKSFHAINLGHRYDNPKWGLNYGPVALSGRQSRGSTQTILQEVSLSSSGSAGTSWRS